MSDNEAIDILFEVKGGGNISGESGARIKGQLLAIAAEINKKPIGVSYKINQKSIDEINKQLKQVGKNKPKEIDLGFDKVSLDAFDKNIKGLTSELQGVKSALADISNLLSNIDVKSAKIRKNSSKTQKGILYPIGDATGSSSNEQDSSHKMGRPHSKSSGSSYSDNGSSGSIDIGTKQYFDALKATWNLQNRILKARNALSAADVQGAQGKEIYSKFDGMNQTLENWASVLVSGDGDLQTHQKLISSVTAAHTKAELEIRRLNEAHKDLNLSTAESNAELQKFKDSNNITNDLSAEKGRIQNLKDKYKDLPEIYGEDSKVANEYRELDSYIAKVDSLGAAWDAVDRVKGKGQAEEQIRNFERLSASINKTEAYLNKYHEAETNASVQSFKDKQNLSNAITLETKKIQTLMEQYEDIPNMYGASSGASHKYKELNLLTDELNGIQDAWNKSTHIVGEGQAEEQVKKFKRIQHAVESLNVSLKEYQDNATTPVRKGSQDYNTMLSKIETSYSTVTKAITSYTAAARGSSKSRAYYQDLKNEATALSVLKAKLDDGKLSQREFNLELSKIRTSINSSISGIRELGNAHLSTGDKIKNAAQRMTVWLTASSMIMHAYTTARRMVELSIELDDAMTQLEIVTRSSSSAYKEFGDEVATTAKQIGASITDLVNSATTYARLGYSLGDSAQLSKYTAMLKNVGDIDVSEAQNAITAITKAFDIPAENIETVMDKLVTTGNNFPISVQQIAEGMNNASSALAASGNSFEQSVALLTAANTTVQDASKASTGLRTIAARIRNTKSELEALGEEVISEAKYEELVSALTKYKVTLTDANNEYRSTYDIISDIAAQWDSMSSMDQASIANALAGVRQQSVFYSMIGQFKEASGAMDAMSNSAGVLESSYNTYLDSMSAHINSFKAAFQQISSNMFDSSVVKLVVDLGTGLLDVLNTLQEINMLIPSIVGIGAIAKANPFNIISSTSKDEINSIISSFVSEKSITEGMSQQMEKLTRAEKLHLGNRIKEAAVNESISKQEAQQILDAIGYDRIVNRTTHSMSKYTNAVRQSLVSIKAQTGASAKAGAAMRVMGTTAKAAGAGLKALWTSIPLWGQIMIVIDLASTAISVFNNHLKDSSELASDLKDSMDKVSQVRQNFVSGSGFLEEIRDKYSDVYINIDWTDDSLGMPKEEYQDFINLNKEIINLMPEVDTVMDTNGNQIINLGNNVSDVNNKVQELIETLRTESNVKIADTLPDVLDTVNSMTSDAREEVEKLQNDLSMMNLQKDTRNAIGADRGSTGDEYIQSKENEIKSLEKQIDNKLATLTPVITAKMQLTPEYDTLTDEAKNVANIMVEEFDLSNIGNISEGEIDKKINEEILTPLMACQEPLSILVNKIEALKERYQRGIISPEEATYGIRTIQDSISDLRYNMDPSMFDTLSNAFVSSMNRMGYAGNNFNSVLQSMSGNIQASSSIINNAMVSGLTSMDSTSFLETFSSITEMLGNLSSLQQSVGESFTMSMEEAMKFAKVYPEILSGAEISANGQITLNSQVVSSLIEDKQSVLDASIDAAIQELKVEKAGIQTKIELAQMQQEMMLAVEQGKLDLSVQGAEKQIELSNQLHNQLIQDGYNEAEANAIVLAAMSGNETEYGRIVGQVAETTGIQMSESARNQADAIRNAMHNAQIHVSDYGRQCAEAAKSTLGIGKGDPNAGNNNLISSGGLGYIPSPDEIKNSITNTFDPSEYLSDAMSQIANLPNAKDIKIDIQFKVKDYRDQIAKIDRQIATLEGLKDIDLSKYNSSDKNKTSTNKPSTNSSSSNTPSNNSNQDDKKNEESWFDKAYRRHKHLVAMDKETLKHYYTWLAAASRKAFHQGKIELQDYYKYSEEVFEGLKQLFEDHLNDIEHETNMRANFAGDQVNVINRYKDTMNVIGKRILELRRQGYKDTDKEIQELQTKWADARQKWIDGQKEITEATKNNTRELINIRINMLKQELEDRKDAINKELDELQEFYDKQKEMLHDARDEEKYLDEQKERRKQVTDIEAELARLELDNSAWAQKRKIELNQELTDNKKELDDFEKDHALETTEEFLDKQYEKQSDEYDKEIKLIEDKLGNAKALYNQALNDVRGGGVDLYKEMVKWNNKYGDGIQKTITNAWNNAYDALYRYRQLFKHGFNGFHMGKLPNHHVNNTHWSDMYVDAPKPKKKKKKSKKPKKPTKTKNNKNNNNKTNNKPKKPAKPPTIRAPKVGNTVTVKKTAKYFGQLSGGARMASFVPGGKFKVYSLSKDKKQVLIGRNGAYTGWIKKSDIVGYAKGTYKATKGIHRIDEKGMETIFQSKDGSRYRMFSGGEKVLNAKASDFLYKFANNGNKILEAIINANNHNIRSEVIKTPENVIDIHMGDIIIKGNANERTVSEIRRAQRDNITSVLNNINKLNK